MVQTHSQWAHQEQEPKDENEFEERGGIISSWDLWRRETPQDENLEVQKYPLENYLQDVRQHIT